MLALSTGCSDRATSLDQAVESLSDMSVGAIALHRAPTAEERRALVRLRRLPRIVAVYTEQGVTDLGRPLLVVEGGTAAEDRGASLLELCRRLHGLRDFDVALRTPDGPESHPAPEEIELVHAEVAAVGYFHDTARGGDKYLELGARWIKGAMFHPLRYEDLGGLRDALPAAAPAVVECVLADDAVAVMRARGVFRA